MSRKKQVNKRVVPADCVYNSIIVTKLINKVLWKGKRRLAERIVYGALKGSSKKLNDNVLKILNKVLDNVQPTSLSSRNRNAWRVNYQMSVETMDSRKLSIGLRWLVESARNRKEKTMIERLTNELIDAYHGVGITVKKKNDATKMAESNRVFVYYQQPTSPTVTTTKTAV